ncbi:hypothetical protein YC2023_039224 [Brassica napus]
MENSNKHKRRLLFREQKRRIFSLLGSTRFSQGKGAAMKRIRDDVYSSGYAQSQVPQSVADGGVNSQKLTTDDALSYLERCFKIKGTTELCSKLGDCRLPVIGGVGSAG